MQTFHELLTQGIQLLMNAAIEEARLMPGSFWNIQQISAMPGIMLILESEVNEEIVSEYLSLCQKRAESIFHCST